MNVVILHITKLKPNAIKHKAARHLIFSYFHHLIHCQIGKIAVKLKILPDVRSYLEEVYSASVVFGFIKHFSLVFRVCWPTW